MAEMLELALERYKRALERAVLDEFNANPPRRGERYEVVAWVDYYIDLQLERYRDSFSGNRSDR